MWPDEVAVSLEALEDEESVPIFEKTRLDRRSFSGFIYSGHQLSVLCRRASFVLLSLVPFTLVLPPPYFDVWNDKNNFPNIAVGSDGPIRYPTAGICVRIVVALGHKSLGGVLDHSVNYRSSIQRARWAVDNNIPDMEGSKRDVVDDYQVTLLEGREHARPVHPSRVGELEICEDREEDN